jgi:hypothetical protein
MFVQANGQSATTGTTRSTTLEKIVEVGDLIAAHGSFENGADLTVVFSNSGTATLSAWTEIAGLDQFVVGEGYGQEVAYARVTARGTLTVTVTFGSAPTWGQVAVGHWNEMPSGGLTLQTSQYDQTATSNPTGTDMTPTSWPAMVIGFCHEWGSPLETPLNDTAAGFTSGGNFSPFTGTNMMLVTYQRITSLTALNIECLNSAAGTMFLSGLIFTEGSFVPPGQSKFSDAKLASMHGDDHFQAEMVGLDNWF